MSISLEDSIDSLLEQAELYAQNHLKITSQDDNASDQSTINLPPLSFSIPEHHLTTLSSILQGDTMEVKETEKGKGFFAKRDLEMGHRLVIAKPIALVMGFEVGDDEEEDDEEDDEDFFENIESSEEEDGDEDIVPNIKEKESIAQENQKQDSSKKTNTQDNESNDSYSIDPLSRATGTKRNGLILFQTLQSIIAKPSIWTDTLNQLFPRTLDEALELPPWICSDVSLGMEIETTVSNLTTTFDKTTAHEIQVRLPLIVRYNVLSMETSSELFVYPDAEKGGMINLEATGLFGPEVSFFNHSNRPNISRYCIGDIMFFVSNRKISKGDELCFSYIEHEFLCESPERRTALLDMDFVDHSFQNGSEDEENHAIQPKHKKQRIVKQQIEDQHEIPMPLINIEMQNELMSTPPVERLEIITDMLNTQQSLNPDHDDYQCDKYNLRLLHSITLENLDRHAEALAEWKKCVGFCIAHFPPIDEVSVAIHVRMAICANSCQEKKTAIRHASEALKMHHFLFGGGVERMRKRYKHEFLLMFGRSSGDGGGLKNEKSVVDALWPCL